MYSLLKKIKSPRVQIRIIFSLQCRYIVKQTGGENKKKSVIDVTMLSSTSVILEKWLVHFLLFRFNHTHYIGVVLFRFYGLRVQLHSNK